MSKPLPNDQIELTNYFTPCYNTLRWCKPQAAVAQSVERRIGSAEVTGPIPVSSFIFLRKKGVESLTVQ